MDKGAWYSVATADSLSSEEHANPTNRKIKPPQRMLSFIQPIIFLRWIKEAKSIPMPTHYPRFTEIIFNINQLL
jgi:hypothetical protein